VVPWAVSLPRTFKHRRDGTGSTQAQQGNEGVGHRGGAEGAETGSREDAKRRRKESQKELDHGSKGMERIRRAGGAGDERNGTTEDAEETEND
jgi:hypothetical protein